MGLDDSIVSIGFIKADTVDVSCLGQCFSNIFILAYHYLNTKRGHVVLSQHKTCTRTTRYCKY
jgi:hypothetical protein